MRFANAAVVAGLAAGFAGMLGGHVLAQQAEQQTKPPQTEKRPESKVKVVWTNDNLPKTPGAISVVGNPAPPVDAAKQTAAKFAKTAPEKANISVQTRQQLQAELDEAKKSLDTSKEELDLLQRQMDLDSAQLYSAPDFANNTEGKARLDNDKTQISAKQSEVDEEQKKVNDLGQQLKNLSKSSDAKPPL